MGNFVEQPKYVTLTKCIMGSYFWDGDTKPATVSVQKLPESVNTLEKRIFIQLLVAPITVHQSYSTPFL